MKTFDSKKLEALKTLALATGGEYSDAQFKATKIPVAERADYEAQLAVQWPDDFGGDEQPEVEQPAPAPAPAPAAKSVKPATPAKGKTYRLRDENGLLRDLELLKDSDTAAIFGFPVQKDLVTVQVKGKPVQIDMVELAKRPTDEIHPEHGIACGILWTLAKIAKA